MKYDDKIIEYMNNHDGYITNKKNKELGVPTIYLTRLVNDKRIARVQEEYMHSLIFLKMNYLLIF